MKFYYQAKTKEGELRSGTIEAQTREMALDLLQKSGLFVTYLREEKSFSWWRRIRLIKGKISQRELVVFTRQLSILIESGVPLVEALWTIALPIKDPNFREKIIRIIHEIEGGSSLSSALSKFPQDFPLFYINLIKSGEMTGKLSTCLKSLADYLEQTYAFRQRTIGALTYPTAILIVFFGVLIFLNLEVFPHFKELFLAVNVELPLPTKIILYFSSFFRDNFIYILLFFLLLVAVLFWFLQKREGKKAFDRFLLKVPILGSFLKEIYLTQIAQALQVLISGGIHLTLALEAISDLVDNLVYKEVLTEMKEKVREGIPFSFLLHSYPEVFSPTFTQLMVTGEKSGTFELVLTNFVNFQQNEIERNLDRFLRMLEPTLIVIVAGLVGFLVASVIVPLYTLISAY